MASVTGLTKDRMEQIEGASVIGGSVVGDNLVLTKHNGDTIQAGSVRGPKGDPGLNGINMTAGNRWSRSTAYVLNNTVGYNGRVYTCIQDNTDKCPAFNNNYWAPVTAGSSDGWPLVNPLFLAEDLDAYDLFWKSGTVTTSLSNTAGEFETGIQSFKMVLGADAFQRIFERSEVIVHGGETITVSVRAKVIGSPTQYPTIGVDLFQTPKDSPPEPFGAGLSNTAANPTTITLSSDWDTYKFTVSAVNGKPRARLSVNFRAAVSVGATIVVDRFEISRLQFKLDQKSDLTYVDSENNMTRFGYRAQRLLMGGGVRKCTSTGVGWTQRFILSGFGQGPDASSGFFEIVMPANGVSIPVYGRPGVSSVAVASNQIPLSNWSALYYELTRGASGASDSTKFRVVDYLSAVTPPPPNWVLIAIRNGDSLSSAYMWGDGRQQDYWKDLTLTNSWVRYNTVFSAPGWRHENDGRIMLRGLMKSGSIGASIPFATLPYPELGPDGSGTSGIVAVTLASAGSYSARLDVYPNGDLVIIALGTGASNGYVSIDNISWHPAGH